MPKPPKVEPLPSYGSHMTVAEFVESCTSGGFIDYDGYGYWANDTEMFSNQVVRPSQVVKEGSDVVKPRFKPKNTHVIWFNR